ncbi:MAG: TonB-dependent siderophore receptor [Nitrospirota bacterium]
MSSESGRGDASEPRSRQGRGGLVAAMLVALIGWFGLSSEMLLAQESSARGERVFDIPAQPLSSALLQFSDVAGLELFYDADMTRGVQTHGVSGVHTREEALRLLLAGTGLTYRVTSEGTVTLERAAPPTPPAPAAQIPKPPATPEGTPPNAQDGQKPVKVPEIVVKEVQDKGYVTEDATSATKSATPLVETPQSITVITRDRMTAQEVNTIAEALRYTAGVQAEPFGFEPRFTFLRFRGFDATTNGLFRDGLQLRNPGFAVSYNLEPYGAERIEVLRGPASFLYGQGSPGGLLNYITKRPTRESFHELQFLSGSFGRNEGRLDFGGRLTDSDAFSYRLTGLFRESGTQIDQVPFDRVYIAPAVTWRAAASTQITLLAHFQKDQLRSSQALPAEGTLRTNPHGRVSPARFTGFPDIDKENRTESAVGYILEHRLAPDWDFVQKLRYTMTELDLMNVFSNTFAADKRTIGRGAFGSLGKLNALTVDNQVHGRFSTGPLQHAVLGGVDFWRITVKLRQTFAAASSIDIFNRFDYGAPFTLPSVFLDQHVTQLQTGIYLQDQVKLYDRLLLTVGGRHDWATNDTRDNMTPSASLRQHDRKATGRAALTYLFDIGLAPYISYSTFFLPSIGLSPTGQPFTPETGRQYEAGLKYQPKGSRSFLTAALFDLTRENYVQVDPGTFFQVQRGKARSRGLELEGLASFDNGLDLIATYTLLDNEVLKSADPREIGKRLTQTPAQFGSVWAKYTVPDGTWKGLGIGGGARYTGHTYSDVANTFRVPSFVVGDAVVDYVWRNYRIALNITNIFNHDAFSCFDRGGTNFCVFGERRTVVGTVAYRW